MSFTGGTAIENNSVDENAVLVKTGPCTVTAMRAYNVSTSTAWVQYFDAAATSDVTVGTTIPRWWIHDSTVGGLGLTLGDGLPSDGLTFVNGVVIASTTLAVGSLGAEQHVRTVIK